MNNRDPLLRLYHMRDYAQRIVRLTKHRTRLDLDENEMLEDALRYEIGIIGEAASKVDQAVRDYYPSIPWKDIVGMRNFLFHAYELIDLDILWNTATINIPNLLDELVRILPTDEV